MTACFSEQKEAKKLCLDFVNLPADDTLNALLARAARHVMTTQEIAAQRRSYVLAEIAIGDDTDEAEYSAALAAGDKAKCAALLAECDERLSLAAKLYDVRYPA